MVSDLDWNHSSVSQFIEFAEYEVKPTIYTFGEIRASTGDFHPDMKLGKGHYGAVYKVCAYGVLKHRRVLASICVIKADPKLLGT